MGMIDVAEYDVRDILDRIHSYCVSASAQRPYFVDTQNANDYHEIKTALSTGFAVSKTSTFCRSNDDNPDIEKQLSALHGINKDTVLLGFFEYLQFKGQKDLSKYLDFFRYDFSNPRGAHLVILTFNCKTYLEEAIRSDLRFRESVTILKSSKKTPLRLYFVDTRFEQLDTDITVRGMKALLERFESGDFTTLNVLTKKVRDDFPHSLLSISEIKDAYELISIKDREFAKLVPQDLGTDENWLSLLAMYKQYSNYKAILQASFGNNPESEMLVGKWASLPNDKKWLALLCMKTNEGQVKSYLGKAITLASSVSTFEQRLFDSLLEYDSKQQGYWSIYSERKKFLGVLNKSTPLVARYVKLTMSTKAESAICYLTDSTELERQAIIENIGQQQYPKAELDSTLQNVYPALFDYLRQYDFRPNVGIAKKYFADLSAYFQEYKYQKLQNEVSDKFSQKVNDLAQTREYNLYLPHRDAVLDKFQPIEEDTELYFVDALGVEFLSYIVQKCKLLSLRVSIEIAHCNLPSITSINKEFLEGFPDEQVTSVRELDEIKHHGKDDFDYTKTKLPLHLTRELTILDDILDRVQSKLAMGKCERVLVVSDHGASRLAILHHRELDYEIYDVGSKGKYGGRCCVLNPSMPDIPEAIKENGWYVLANYDLFRGSRPSQVETHGGASLEEVVVPIIEITIAEKNVAIRIVKEVLVFSHRKQPQLSLYASVKLSAPTVLVNGKKYLGVPQDNNLYAFALDGLKAGRYTASLLDGDNHIADGLDFAIESEGMKEQDLF
jgi:hypothetical protein